MDGQRLVSQRLLILLQDEIAGIEAEYEDFSPSLGGEGRAVGSVRDLRGGKERIERIAQATRTFEKLMELRRAELADADKAKDEDAEAERLRDELLARLKAIDLKRMMAMEAKVGTEAGGLGGLKMPWRDAGEAGHGGERIEAGMRDEAGVE